MLYVRDFLRIEGQLDLIDCLFVCDDNDIPSYRH